MNSSGKYLDVIGYLTENERIALQRCVLETSRVTGDALEIGSLNGLSALIIWSVLALDKKLLCIEKGQVETLNANLLKHAIHHVTRTEGWAVFNDDFKNVDLGHWPLSFVFIDHDHTFENTRAAFDQFWGSLSVGGIMAFHDYSHPDFEDGTRAINAIMKGRGMEPYLQADSLIAFKK